MSQHNQNSCCGGKNQTSASSCAKTDPVCKMTVDPSTAKNSLEHEGTKYYFCCAGCLKKFAAEPKKYL